MDTAAFINHPEVVNIVEDLSTKIKGKIFSDTIDEKGNQYIDLVQEGGGVLGVALLGYTYVLEQMGIRFFSLGGTSAGAINTLLLGSLGKIDELKTEKILEILANKNLFDLVDGPSNVRRFIKSVINNSWTGFKVLWGISVIPHFLKNNGLNPGDNFLGWITGILQSNGIQTTDDLLKLRTKPDGLKLRSGIEGNVDDLIPKLKIITADITTESRIIFPEMNILYWDDPMKIVPAVYVRTSMSIPGFFYPYKVKVGKKVKKEDWENVVMFEGDVPEETCFVDGGVMSNFPIDVFHNRNRIPRLPTFGIKLGDDRNKANEFGTLAPFLMAVFNSARHLMDYQFLLQNEDYEKLISKIDVGKHNWLNFSIKDEDKIDLFIRGAKTAKDFLINFNWEGYKDIRKQLIIRKGSNQ